MPRRIPEWAMHCVMLTCLALFWWAMRSPTGQWLDDPLERVELGHLAQPPSLAMQAHSNAQGDVWVVLNAANFRFSEACLDPQSEGPPLGHAHLYVDGKKYASLYRPQALIRQLSPGPHVITATLNVLPNHEFVTLAGKPIERHLRIEVPPS